MAQSIADAHALKGVAAACPTTGRMSSVAAVRRQGNAATPQPSRGSSIAPIASQLAARTQRLKTVRVDTGALVRSGCRVDVIADEAAGRHRRGGFARQRVRLRRVVRRGRRPLALHGRESSGTEIVGDGHGLPRVTLGVRIRLPHLRRHWEDRNAPFRSTKCDGDGLQVESSRRALRHNARRNARFSTVLTRGFDWAPFLSSQQFR